MDAEKAWWRERRTDLAQPVSADFGTKFVIFAFHHRDVLASCLYLSLSIIPWGIWKFICCELRNDIAEPSPQAEGRFLGFFV